MPWLPVAFQIKEWALAGLKAGAVFPVWKDHQSVMFHLPSVRSQVGLRSIGEGLEMCGDVREQEHRHVLLIKHKSGESPRTWDWIIYELGERKQRSMERWGWIQEAAKADELVWLHLPGAEGGAQSSLAPSAPPLHGVYVSGRNLWEVSGSRHSLYYTLVDRE